jgi:hypothetical protein
VRNEVEGYLVGLAIGLAVLLSLYLSRKKSIADEAWFTRLDQKTRRAKMLSKWYYWPCLAFTSLLTFTAIIFVVYQVLMIAKLLWNAK